MELGPCVMHRDLSIHWLNCFGLADDECGNNSQFDKNNHDIGLASTIALTNVVSVVIAACFFATPL